MVWPGEDVRCLADLLWLHLVRDVHQARIRHNAEDDALHRANIAIAFAKVCQKGDDRRPLCHASIVP